MNTFIINENGQDLFEFSIELIQLGGEWTKLPHNESVSHDDDEEKKQSTSNNDAKSKDENQEQNKGKISLLLPGPEVDVWLSFKLFGVLTQSNKFLYHQASTMRRIKDKYVLRGDRKEIIKSFSEQRIGNDNDANFSETEERTSGKSQSKSKMTTDVINPRTYRYIDIYLCTYQRVIAVGRIDVEDILGLREANATTSKLNCFGRKRIVLNSWECPIDDNALMDIQEWNLKEDSVEPWLEVEVGMKELGNYYQFSPTNSPKVSVTDDLQVENEGGEEEVYDHQNTEQSKIDNVNSHIVDTSYTEMNTNDIQQIDKSYGNNTDNQSQNIKLSNVESEIPSNVYISGNLENIAPEEFNKSFPISMDKVINQPSSIRSNIKSPSPLRQKGLQLSEREAMIKEEKEQALLAMMGALEVEKRRIEWEEWRHQEELKWHQKLREQEKMFRTRLEEEYREKEKERNLALKNTQEEYHRLEVKLKKALFEVEKKERFLTAQEDELKQNYSLKIMEIQSVARRSREESKVLLEGEKLRNKDLTSRIVRLEQDNENLQEQINTVQEENSSLRKDLSKRGDSLSGLNMQLLLPSAGSSSATETGGNSGNTALTIYQEMASLRADKAEAELRYQREKSDKNKVMLEKEQYRHACHRLARALKREQKKQQISLREEVDKLKLEYLAREERFVLDGEKEELFQLRHELESLKNLTINEAHQDTFLSRQTEPHIYDNPTHPKKDNSMPVSTSNEFLSSEREGIETILEDATDVHSISNELKEEENSEKDVTNLNQSQVRLLHEKRELLATGIYSEEDPVIQEINLMLENGDN